MFDLAGTRISLGNQDVPQFFSGLALLAQCLFQLFAGYMAGGHQQFAQPERAGGRSLLVVLEIQQRLELAFGQKAEADQHLTDFLAAVVLLLDGLVQLLRGYMAGVHQEFAQQLPFTGGNLDRISDMVEMLLQQQGRSDISRIQQPHPDQDLAQEFPGVLLLIQGTFKTLGGEQFAIQQYLADRTSEKVSHRHHSFPITAYASRFRKHLPRATFFPNSVNGTAVLFRP